MKHDDEMLNEDDVVEVVEVDDIEEEDGIEIEDDSKCTFTKHTDSVFCGSLSIDGKLAATGGQDDKAFIWDTSTGDVTLECSSFTDSVIFVDFNHDNTLVAMADMHSFIKVWELKSKKLIWDSEISEITWMQWHFTENILITTSNTGEIYTWKIPDGDCTSFQPFGQYVATALLLPDGKRLVAAYENGYMRVFDLQTGTVLSTISSAHTNEITSIDCHPNSNLLISASIDGTTVLTTPHSGKIVSVLQKLSQDNNIESNEEEMEEEDNSNWVEYVKFHSDPHKSIAATGTREGEIFVWDTAKQTLRNKIILSCGITKLLWKQNTTLIFAAGLSGMISCCDGWTGEILQFYSGHTNDILDICISKDGKTMLTTSDDKTARIFEIQSN